MQKYSNHYGFLARPGVVPPLMALPHYGFLARPGVVPPLMALPLAYSSWALPPSSSRYFGRTYFSYTPKQARVHRRFNKTKLKTQLCREFEEQGKCDFGLQCDFAHGVEELRKSNPLFRTKPCRRYVQSGQCANGNNCNFIHTDNAKDSLNGSERSSATSERTAERESSGASAESHSPGETGEGESSGETGDSDSSGETGESESSGETGESESSGETGESESSGETGESDSSEETGDSDSSGETGDSDSSGEDSECPLLELILGIYDWEFEWPALNEYYCSTTLTEYQ